jgi:hypothetical protein
MRSGLLAMILLVTIGFASQVVSFDNNWGKNHMFNIVSSTTNGMDIVFSMHSMVIEDIMVHGVLMNTYGIPGVFLPNDEGAPNVEGTGRYIAIPQGARVHITVVDARTEIYHNVDIAPAPNIPLEIDDSPLRYNKDMAIYDNNAYYPDTPVRASEPTAIRGVDVIILGVTPFQYNPVTKDLIVYKDLRIRVDFVGGNGHFGEDRLRSRFWDPLLKGILLNYDVLPEIDFYAPERIHRQTGCEYIIIVPDDANFIPWGDTIKIWRKKQGISCEVYTLTQVGGNTTTAIENFLNNAYNTWDIPPVAFLLLSDYQSSGDVYGITSPTHSYYSYTCVTDNMYADVNGNALPDMHHARICAQNSTHLSTMINKFLSYERNPYTVDSFYDHPLVACAWQTERWFQLCGEVIRGFLINSLSKNPARQYAIYSGTPVVGGAWSTATNTSTVVTYFSNLGYIPTTNQNNSSWWSNGSSTGITNAINAGAFLVQHRDHGMEMGWGEPYYTTSHLNNLTNTMFTYVLSTNCLTGKYNYGAQVFTELFHRMVHGALAVNAASEVSFSFVNDAYVWGMYDCMWQQFMPDYPAADLTPYGILQPCIAMTYGKYFLSTSSWPYNASSKVTTYHLFHHHGDCFDVLYDEIPLNLTVDHATTLLAGATTFAVSADDSSIIALTVDNEIIGVAEGTGSLVDIDILPQTQGDTVLVTVTKAGYYRYEALVPVVDVGIQEGHESIRDFATVSLYPVVSRDFFTLQYGFSAKTTVCVSIYNALGHLVDHQDYGKLVGTGDLTLNFPSLAQGVYFVKIDAGDQTTTTKVIFVK